MPDGSRMMHKKAYPRRAPDELGIEQTRDLTPVRSLLEAAGLGAEGLDWPSACYLVAYKGNSPVGSVGIEARVDAALLRSLAVIEPMRRRGVGEALVRAARVAAHTRGARTLYTLASAPRAAWFVRLGFAPVPLTALTRALAGTFLIDYWRGHHPRRLEELVALAADIANDGVIQR
jgi:N-acetylglutamate synthase-like GNAT family acetyltransferase